jgi:hypothetical protein
MHIVCATVNNNVVTAAEQVKTMYGEAKVFSYDNVKWHYYRQSDPTEIHLQTHLGTVFVDGRNGLPRLYVEDRDVTDAAGNLQWVFNGI